MTLQMIGNSRKALNILSVAALISILLMSGGCTAQRDVSCAGCGGTGKEGWFGTCSKCGGKGQVRETYDPVGETINEVLKNITELVLAVFLVILFLAFNYPFVLIIVLLFWIGWSLSSRQSKDP